MSAISLESEIQYLNGVGPERASLLNRLGIENVGDLLWYLPRDVLDYSNVREPHDLLVNEVATVKGRVIDLDARPLSGGRTLTIALLDCGTDYVRGTWFNQPWMIKRLSLGHQVLFSGKPRFQKGHWEFSHPNVQWLDEGEENDQPTTGPVLPRYRLTEGLKVHELRRLIANALDAVAESVTDPLPEEFCSRLKMPALTAALQGAHRPQSLNDYQQSRKRLIFDDLFEFQLGVALRRRAWRARCHAPVIERTAKIDARIRRLFPFAYTKGQNQAVEEIAGDLKSGYAMHRLLQADVGAGKTVVAIDTLLAAVAHGWQAVMMAPTELLASQHWQVIDDALRESRVKRALFTGGLTPKKRQQLLAEIADGSLQLIIGTQALIQDDVRFHHLGVVVIDEQHKFGVAQRSKFSNHGDSVPPHVLVMTATPIPRTLCLTQFGDLDVTLVKDRPQGRQPVLTNKVSTRSARTQAWDFVKEKLKSGRQLYVVCPQIDGGDDEASQSGSAEFVYQQLQQAELHGFRMGLIHGRMKPEEREPVMEAFRERELDVLVATTVIEVGVDIPNATLMVILNAERFGLSQLHQLRGRVARGKFRGYCFLFSESEAAEAQSRLAVLERSSDGFEVAEQDFDLRGPGDILGTRQHGDLPLRFASHLKEEKILELARKEAFQLVRSGELDQPHFALLKEIVLMRFSQLLDLPRTG